MGGRNKQVKQLMAKYPKLTSYQKTLEMVNRARPAAKLLKDIDPSRPFDDCLFSEAEKLIPDEDK